MVDSVEEGEGGYWYFPVVFGFIFLLWGLIFEVGPLTVLKTPMIKSMTYASVPAEPTDNEYNTRRIPVLVYECIRFLKHNGMFSPLFFVVPFSTLGGLVFATLYFEWQLV